MPANFSQAKFEVIWGFIIAFHIIFDILLFFSLLACILRTRWDYAKKDMYNIEASEGENEDANRIDIFAVQIDKAQ